MRPAKCFIAAHEIPAVLGLPGPGEITKCVGFNSSSSESVVESLRYTVVWLQVDRGIDKCCM